MDDETYLADGNCSGASSSLYRENRKSKNEDIGYILGHYVSKALGNGAEKDRIS